VRQRALHLGISDFKSGHDRNFQAAVALNFAYYNFVKTYGALKMTPAMAAGIESTFWPVEELVKRCGE